MSDGGKNKKLSTWSVVLRRYFRNLSPSMSKEPKYNEKLHRDLANFLRALAEDVVDVEGDAAAVGKAVRKDDAAGKATFVSLLGLDGAKGRATELVTQACDALEPYGDDAETLRAAARFVIDRDR